MKHELSLQDVLKSKINIDQTRLGKAETAHNSLQDFLNNSSISNTISSFSLQWSYSYKTIIKPQWEDWEYDVDLAINMKYNEDYNWNEKLYHQIIIDELKNSDKYRTKINLTKDRSIRIDYDVNDWEFHIDLVPLFKKNWETRVVNRKTNTTEISWWEEFKIWLNSKNTQSSNNLKKVIRILKFFRENSRFDIKSVQLTLLCGKQIDKISTDKFADLTDSLYYITKELNNLLQQTILLKDLDLSNPLLNKEKFDRNITQESYQEFRESFNILFNDIEKAYLETDENNSKNLWDELFGWGFGWSAKTKSMIPSYPHEQKVTQKWWSVSPNIPRIGIYCRCLPKYSTTWRAYSNNGITLQEWSILQFFAKLPENLDWSILHRQVTNAPWSDQERWEIDNQRKEIQFIKWLWWGIEETTAYSGKHWVKCFLVKNNIVIRESDRFYVNIYTNHNQVPNYLKR